MPINSKLAIKIHKTTCYKSDAAVLAKFIPPVPSRFKTVMKSFLIELG